MTRSIKKIWNQYLKKINRRDGIVFIFLLFLVFVGLFYYSQNKPQHVLPPKFNADNQTYEAVLSFIKNDDTDSIPYGTGFNCVDSAFKVYLNSRWQGIISVPIVIQYTESPGHMVIGFPTSDKGDIFFETQTDQQISLGVGKFYNERMIRGFYCVDIFNLIPLANSANYDTNMEIK